MCQFIVINAVLLNTSSACHFANRSTTSRYIRWHLAYLSSRKYITTAWKTYSQYRRWHCQLSGLSDDSLHAVFQAIVVNRLSYASPAWWGFVSADDRHRLEAFLRRSARLGYRANSSTTFASICDDADDQLFERITAATVSTYYIGCCHLNESSTTVYASAATTTSCPSQLLCWKTKTSSLECCIILRDT